MPFFEGPFRIFFWLPFQICFHLFDYLFLLFLNSFYTCLKQLNTFLKTILIHFEFMLLSYILSHISTLVDKFLHLSALPTTVYTFYTFYMLFIVLHRFAPNYSFLHLFYYTFSHLANLFLSMLHMCLTFWHLFLNLWTPFKTSKNPISI